MSKPQKGNGLPDQVNEYKCPRVPEAAIFLRVSGDISYIAIFGLSVIGVQMESAGTSCIVTHIKFSMNSSPTYTTTAEEILATYLQHFPPYSEPRIFLFEYLPNIPLILYEDSDGFLGLYQAINSTQLTSMISRSQASSPQAH